MNLRALSFIVSIIVAAGMMGCSGDQDKASEGDSLTKNPIKGNANAPGTAEAPGKGQGAPAAAN